MAIHRHFIVVAIAVALHVLCRPAAQPPRTGRNRAGPIPTASAAKRACRTIGTRNGPEYAWRLPLPGPAGATPVVWVTTFSLLPSMAMTSSYWRRTPAEKCFGSGRWTRAIEPSAKTKGIRPLPSPWTDGHHVWAMSGTGKLACFDFAGEKVWTVDVQERYGRFQIQWGFSTTPLLDGDRLDLQLIHSGGATIACLDKKTGNELSLQKRPSDARDECEQSYALPIIYRAADRAMLLTHGADYIVAHNLADGSELWRCGGLNSKGQYNHEFWFVASPVAAPGLIVVPSAKNGPVLGLGPTATATSLP